MPRKPKPKAEPALEIFVPEHKTWEGWKVLTAVRPSRDKDAVAAALSRYASKHPSTAYGSAHRLSRYVLGGKS